MLETYLINTNFVLLFGTCLFYWLSAYHFLPLRFQFIGRNAVLVSQAFQAGFLCVRWFNSGHFPLSNLYESLLFLSWVLTVLLGIINQTQRRFNLNHALIGSIMMPVILLVNTFALFSLPGELKINSALVPALQSNWLVMHVTVMILSYAALICGCLFSMAYLVLTTLYLNDVFWISEGSSLMPSNGKSSNATFAFEKAKGFSQLKTKKLTSSSGLENSGLESSSSSSCLNSGFSSSSGSEVKVNFEQQFQRDKSFLQLSQLLDNLSYRTLGFGFPLLTIGLLSGSIWANQTWGSYWSWDPKETWALITWFIFAIYLHTRFSKGWGGRESAMLATFGFFILWICYLGVNLMGKGLHSYGFLS